MNRLNSQKRLINLMRTCEPLAFGVSSSFTSNDSFGLTILADFTTTSGGYYI
jgi:hypothetical protein